MFPNLPSGLGIDQASGKISGKPVAPSTVQPYRITGLTPVGSSSESLIITVIDVAVSNLQYSGTPYAFTECMAITPDVPSSSGGN